MTAFPLAALVGAPARAGLFLDFDGVLADIAPTPEGAVPRPGITDLLVELRHRLGRLAVVSGRPVDYLAPLLPVEIDLVGLYGLESRVDGVGAVIPEAEAWRPIIDELTADANSRFGPAVVEAKGLSLTVHYRTDEHLAQPMKDWAVEVARRTGAEARAAKRSFEVHPPVERNKGTAVVELGLGLDVVAYAGDDLGDLPAFDGLDHLAALGATTLRVAVASVEAPPALLSRADHVVDGPTGAQQMLERLSRELGSESA